MPDRPTFIIQSTMRNGDWRLMLSHCLILLSSHCLFLNPATQCSGRETVIHLPLMAVSDYQPPGLAWVYLWSRHLSLVLQPLSFGDSFIYLLQHLFIYSFIQQTFIGQPSVAKRSSVPWNLNMNHTVDEWIMSVWMNKRHSSCFRGTPISVEKMDQWRGHYNSSLVVL